MKENLQRADFDRKGPSPFPVHAALAMASYTILQGEGRDPGGLQKMLAGIRKYQNHPYKRAALSLPCIWQEGAARLFYCAAKLGEPVKARLFLTPSLINGSEIFDLLPERSFVRWLSGCGIESYLLDWGNPATDEGAQDMGALVEKRLCAAMRAAFFAAGEKIHALGYCMGGTLLAAAVMRQKEILKGLVFLATPWDFHAGDRVLANLIDRAAPAAVQAIERKGFLPVSWIQSVFAALNAERAMQKFADFSAMADESDSARLFVAVEDWLNHGADMPGSLAKTCLFDWYRENKPARGLWNVAGAAVDPALLDVPSLVIASPKDRLVPPESSAALAAQLPHVTLLTPASGHIGMMTGRGAQAQLWDPLAAWLFKNP